MRWPTRWQEDDMIAYTLFDKIQKDDRTRMYLKAASHAQGNELAFYFAARCFYADPSYPRAVCMRNVFLLGDSVLQVNTNSAAKQAFTQNLFTWNDMISNLRGNPRQLETFRRTLFDGVWQGIQVQLVLLNDHIELVELDRLNCLHSNYFGAGNYPLDSAHAGLALLSEAGIVFERC